MGNSKIVGLDTDRHSRSNQPATFTWKTFRRCTASGTDYIWTAYRNSWNSHILAW